jgi:hypothetical protein
MISRKRDEKLAFTKNDLVERKCDISIVTLFSHETLDDELSNKSYTTLASSREHIHFTINSRIVFM